MYQATYICTQPETESVVDKHNKHDILNASTQPEPNVGEVVLGCVSYLNSTLNLTEEDVCVPVVYNVVTSECT